MTDANRSTRNWKSGAWGAVLAVMLAVFLPPPLAPWLDDLSYDVQFRLRASIPTEQVLVIHMDKDSADSLRQPWNSEAWDRSLHARLLNRLTEGGAKAVVFDILFDKPGTNDAPLLKAIAAATNSGTLVLVGGRTEISIIPGKDSVETLVTPFAALETGVPWGMAEAAGEDALLRRHYPGFEGRDDWIPSLSWRAAELCAPRRPPGRPTDLRWINYYGPPGWLNSRHYQDVLEPDRLPSTLFTNKICFVGALPGSTPFAGPTRADVWRTPYSRWGQARMPGVEVIATVYLNLARRDFLTWMPVWHQLVIFVACGLIFGWGLSLFRPMLAVYLGLAGMAAVAGAAAWTLSSHHLWFSWLTIALVQIPVSIGWSVLTNSKRLAREKEALATQLAAAQTALKEVATAAGEAATRVDPSTRGADGQPAAEVPAIISRGAADGRPVIPDHDLVRCVGKGAYGEVWLARNVIGTYHAVKIVKRDDFQSAEPFEREFKGIQKFMPISRSHPGFVQILHAGRNQSLGYIYYIMETADDETTGQQIDPDTYKAKNLAREIKKRGHLPAAECLQLSLDLTAALDYLHQQHLIHRDIKPSNIIFVKGVPKFADIGLVTDIAPTGRETTFLGTFGYIPPEGPGTPGADVFSLGKVLYEASTGRGCESFPEMSSTIRGRSDSAEHFQLNQIILKACQDNPDQRYRTAAEMRADLLGFHRTTAVRPA